MEIVSDRFSDCQRPPRQPKITTKSVRECLQPESLSEFQARMTQIRSILVLKNSDKEWSVGKSRPKFANLPSHLVDSDFGYRARDPNNVDNTIHGEYEHDANYEAEKQPGYQLTRRYESPFDRCQTFGRSLRLDPRSSRIQRLFQYQSGECECEADRKTGDDRLKLLADGGSEDIFDRIVAQSSSNNIYEVFHGAPVQRDLTDVKNALAHVNSLRLIIKKRDSDLIFLELMDHYNCVDKVCGHAMCLRFSFTSLINSIIVRTNVRSSTRWSSIGLWLR
ncbi:uncharacterized protein LOC111694078 [Trichogramma pretiosum]|uniref:uncharacterized protein LOC111694078 n=1 Tax=Trichogramma pretiosum TaxID=7493 RepID=UPI000C71C28A|nr:uncharacterized protein LOC111694078 [Trichogramma pretiosum]